MIKFLQTIKDIFTKKYGLRRLILKKSLENLK